MVTKASLTILIVSISFALVSSVVVSGVLNTSKTIQSTGKVKSINVGVYWNSACTNVTTSINWGTIEPNSTVTRTVYVKNTGNSPLTLHLSSSGWNPANSNQYMTLTWDRENAVVSSGSVATAVLTFRVSSSITGITDFSFDIIVEGTG